MSYNIDNGNLILLFESLFILLQRCMHSTHGPKTNIINGINIRYKKTTTADGIRYLS